METTSKNYFNSLSKEEKDKLRREYRSTYFKDYCYSIRLYILQSILGAFSVLGLIIMFFDNMVGILLFSINFIFILIVVYFLNLSNKPFYEFINKKRLR